MGEIWGKGAQAESRGAKPDHFGSGQIEWTNSKPYSYIDFCYPVWYTTKLLAD